MTTGGLNDAQLFALLGQVASPAEPAPDLTDRIVARAVATARLGTGRPAKPRQIRLRRSPAIWSAVIAANALAAAAAAASWDGQRFDFHRLADLPHRVAAAIHPPRHHALEPERRDHRQVHPQSHDAATPAPVPLAPAPSAGKRAVHHMPVPVTISRATSMQVPAPHAYRQMRAIARPANRPALHRETIEEARAADKFALNSRAARRQARHLEARRNGLEKSLSTREPQFLPDGPPAQDHAIARPEANGSPIPERSAENEWRDPNPRPARVGGFARPPRWNHRRPGRPGGGGGDRRFRRRS